MIKNKHTPEQSHSTIKRVLRQTFSNRLSYYNEEQIDAGCSDRASEICKAAESLGIVLGDVSELTKQRDELLAALRGLVASCDTGERGPDGRQHGTRMPDRCFVQAGHDAIARVKGQA